ncbi:MAG: bacterial Ig-like domain-containing protein [Treponema sp.]|nr:bacterial Ig-like domain-containing protein [Candidatus Treponema merdequi]
MRKVLGIGAAVLCSLVVLFTGCSAPSEPSSPSMPSTPSTPSTPSAPGSSDPILEKIEITAEPARKEYYVGSSQINTIGMIVKATYNNSTTIDVTEEVKINGFDSSAATDSKTITVTYGEKSADFIIKIVPSQPYSFHNTVTVLPSGTTGSYGTEGSYVEFGDWPQNVVSEADAEILELENSKDKITRGYMEFVQGLDGNYYVKHKLKWYKVMPIKWRVADTAYDVDGKNGSATGKLLVAESILTGNVPYYEKTGYKRIINGGISSNNYTYSQIRAYLNGNTYIYYSGFGSNEEKSTWQGKGFLQTAFTSDAIDNIIITKVDNSSLSTTDKDGKLKPTNTGSISTDDRIFLLSEYEVTKYSKEAYDESGKGNSRIRFATDFAKANNVNQNTTDGFGSIWWLRTPGPDGEASARIVLASGYAGSTGGVVYETDYGVVPALSISF